MNKIISFIKQCLFVVAKKWMPYRSRNERAWQWQNSEGMIVAENWKPDSGRKERAWQW